MTKTKVTVFTSAKTYISVDIPGKGRDDTNYNVREVLGQLDSSKFPSFSGTEQEWKIILKTADNISIQNLGVM